MNYVEFMAGFFRAKVKGCDFNIKCSRSDQRTLKNGRKAFYLSLGLVLVFFNLLDRK